MKKPPPPAPDILPPVAPAFNATSYISSIFGLDMEDAVFFLFTHPLCTKSDDTSCYQSFFHVYCSLLKVMHRLKSLFRIRIYIPNQKFDNLSRQSTSSCIFNNSEFESAISLSPFFIYSLVCKSRFQDKFRASSQDLLNRQLRFPWIILWTSSHYSIEIYAYQNLIF